MSTKISEPTHAYLGRKPACGCIVAAVVYSFSMRGDTASTVAEMIKDGLIVESVPWNEYGQGDYELAGCQHGPVVGDGTQQGTLSLPE